MTRNTYFAALVFGLMALFSNNMMAQHHCDDRGRHGHEYDYCHDQDRGCGPGRGFDHDRGCGPGRDFDHDRGCGPGRGFDHDRGCGPDRGHHNYRDMHGHHWDRNGWMEGYHGRVRHFDDGRWGYLRDGRWYYYDRFFEPDYYYAHPVAHFHDHIYYREMHGHRWDHDGWMYGYHGRVRHFNDGRWGYLRNGRWYYYDRFFEPDYYYAHPVADFHRHARRR